MKFRPGLLLISCISFFTLTGFTGATDFCSPIYCDSPATDSDKPWYGISLPPGLAAPHKAPIDVSGFSPAPACFLIVAVWAFSKSNPELSRKILQHPQFGPPIKNWMENKSINRKEKCTISLSIVIGFSLSFNHTDG